MRRSANEIDSRTIKAFVDSYLMETLLKVPAEFRGSSKIEDLDELAYQVSKKDSRLGSKLEEKISDGFYELVLDNRYGEDDDEDEDDLRDQLHEGAWDLLTRKGIVGRNMKQATRSKSASETIRNLEMRIARLENRTARSNTANDFFCTNQNVRTGTSNFRNSQGVNIFFDVDKYGSPMIRGNQRLHMKEGIYESLNAMMEEYGKTNYYSFVDEVADAVGMYLNGKGQTLGSILDLYYK